MNAMERWLECWARVIERFGLFLAAGILVLSAVSAFYVKGNLGVNTKTAEMFPSDLPFRMEKDRLIREFPQLEDMLLVVVEFGSPEANRAMAQRMASRLRDEPDIADVFHFLEDDFFTRHGLLYLQFEEIEEHSDRLAEAQPFLSGLMRDPSLRGLLSRLTQVFTHADELELEAVDSFLAELNHALDATLAGEHTLLSWQAFMQDDPGNQEPRYLMIVNPRMDFSRLLPAGGAIEAVRRNAGELMVEEPVPGRFRLTGEVALGFEEMDAAKDGAIFAAVLAFLLVSLLLSVGLRSPRLIVASMITLLCGLSLTAGFATFWVGTLNMISLAFAVLYIGLGVDFAIHLCLHYRNSLAEGGSSRDALTLTIRKTGVALALCSASTSLGFYVFLFTDFQGVSELGIIAGSGMIVSLVVSLTLMPVFLTHFPLKKAPPEWRIFTPHFRDRILSIPQRFPGVVRTVALILGGLALLCTPWIRFDNDPLNLRNRDSESMQALYDLIDDGMASPWTVELLVDDLEQLADVSEQLSKLEGVDRVVSLLSLVPRDQEWKLDQIMMMDMILGGMFAAPPEPLDAPSGPERLRSVEEFAAALAEHADPERPLQVRLQESLDRFLSHLSQIRPRERDKLLLQLEESLLTTFEPAMEDLRLSLTAEPVEISDLPPRLAQRWVNEDGVYRIQVFPHPDIRSPNELRAFAHSVEKIFPAATGDLIVTKRAGEVVVRAFQQAFLYAFIAIVVLLLLYTRSWADTSLILFPLLLAAAFTAAAMVALGIPFNFANIIALPLLLGYGVNNGIHVVHRARNMNPGEIFLETSTARAVFYSSLTTISSFGTLSFSPHPGTATMGIVLTLGLLFTLLATLVALPAFLPHSPFQPKEGHPGF